MADLRALMKERKAASKRIDHPYARYSNAGQLSCSLCTLTVKNEVLWPAHLTSKVHRQNVRQAQLAVAEAEAQAEEEEREQAGLTSTSTSSGSGLGTKRGADDEAEMDGGGAKRVRFQDESHEKDSVEGQHQTNNAASATGLPAGFFDDPSQAPAPDETSQTQAPEDDEMAEFEAFLAQEQPEASTSTSAAGPAVYSAQATISGQAALFGDDTEGENGETQEQQADGDEDDYDEPQETEAERQAREEREELMERIEL
jgi:zinc finger protein 830